MRAISRRMVLGRLGVLPWLLMLLHVLLLGSMLLLELLGLLSVTLLHLLFVRVIGAFPVGLLVFFFLLLLQFLMFLTLFLSELLLLVLIALCGRGIAGVRRRGGVRLEVTGVTVRSCRCC